MNIILIDGFDLYNGIVANIGLAAKWTVVGVPVMVAGRLGGQAVSQTGVNTTTKITRALAAPVTEIGIGCAIRFDTLPTADTTFLTLLGNTGITSQVYFKVSVTGQLMAYSGTNVPLGVSAANAIVANAFHFIEIGTIVNDTTGRVRIKLDGATLFDTPNVDTKNGTVLSIDTLQYLMRNGAGAPILTVDDLYIVDTFDTVGERRVETLRPVADTATKSFVPSTGVSNYAVVDDTVADSSDYISASTVGDADLYQMADLSSNPQTIDAVQLTMFAQKTDANSRNVALVANVTGVAAQSSDFALPVNITKQDAIMPFKPGGGAWNTAAVNAMLMGPKVTL